MGVAEEEGLIGEEQGGFRKQRGCRDQVLSLVLLGQMEMLKKLNGMMVAFIDFSKAYDKIDRDKLWVCVEQLGVNGNSWTFCNLCIREHHARLELGTCRVGYLRSM